MAARSARDLMTAGYADAESRHDEAHDRRLAGAFRFNPVMENLLQIRQDDPAAYDRLGVSLHVSVGYYLAARQADDRFASRTAEAWAAQKGAEPDESPRTADYYQEQGR